MTLTPQALTKLSTIRESLKKVSEETEVFIFEAPRRRLLPRSGMPATLVQEVRGPSWVRRRKV